MKIGFSTLVCPDWQWKDVLASASDLGFDGVELRGIGKEIYLPNISLFNSERIGNTIAGIKRLNLTIPCLTSGIFLFDRSLAEAAQKEAAEYIKLAASLGVPYIRMMGDRDPAPGVVDEQAVEENLQKILPLAEENGVALLIETNGVFANSKRLLSLMEKFNNKHLGVLWDVHHPYRYFGESPEDTYANIAPYVRHIHVKDSALRDNKLEYRMMGYGDVPIAEAIRLLKLDGYDGFVVLEWVRRWDMSLEEPGIVLPHFLNAIKSMMMI